MTSEKKIAVFLALASLPAGVALMAVPQLFPHAPQWILAWCFYGGIPIAAILIIAALSIPNGDKLKTRSKRKMIALIGMVLSAAVCGGFAISYFWPQGKLPIDVPLGSLSYQEFTAAAVRKSGTKTTSIQMIVELRNNNDFLLKFKAKMSNGHINGKKLEKPDATFDGVVYPKQNTFLRYGRIFDIPLGATQNPAVPAYAGGVDYDVTYWAGDGAKGEVRRTGKRLSFEVWPDPVDKPRGTHEEWKQIVGTANQVEE
jgi:hypothetical protein